MKQRAVHGLALWTLVAASSCLQSRGVGDSTPAADGASATSPDGSSAAGSTDLGGGADAAPCITTITCQALDPATAHDCGVAGAGGWRYPDKGAPYCTGAMMSYDDCSCELVRCVSAAPLCAGQYQVQFWEKLDRPCSGGSCQALWNVVRSHDDGSLFFIEQRFANDLETTFTNEQHAFTVRAPTVVELAVKQYCRFADVSSGAGDLAGGGEVQRISVAPQ